MSTEDRAATCIQARFRGFQWRRKQRRGIKAVTMLQALQRGRFTRREFAELREFSREQASFQQATRRRQTRIWRNEQELYFLRHTNAADLERVLAFQQQHSARLIQRSWRATTQSAATSKEDKGDILDPSDRIYAFDPFGLAIAGVKMQTVPFRQWRHDEECAGTSQLSPSLFLNKEDFRVSGSVRKLPALLAGEEEFASRRKRIQERIKRKAAQEKANTESTPKLRAYVRSGTTEGTKPVVNRRRELYDEVVAMKNATVKRVLRYERGTRASRPDKELFSAQLAASCENRVKHLRGESTEQMAALEENSQQVHDEAQIMEKWDPARRIRAWNHHRCAVCSVLNKRHWWQTKLAGDERDIRRVVVAKSPWEDEKNIWVWPRSESDHQKDDTDSARSPFSVSSWPSMEIQRFLFGDNGMEAPQDQLNRPVSDDEASEWWRAHCTQSHLATNGTLIIEKPYSAEFSSNVSNEGDVFPVCTSEVVANRDLYKLQEQAKRAARTRSLERDVEQRIKDLTTQVERRVHEMEVQVEANTQLALEILQRKKEQRARISREQQASMTIQRYARGMQGRKCAREVRAEFFVLVRGRAIRRGRCEECGDQRAVLECQQCEESLHFCPICWVHVHSTRRRKTHVAIPMATVVAPTPVQEAESTKSSTMKESTADSSQAKVVSIEENLVPSLRSLPSPPKQSTTRSAEPARVKLKKPVIDTKNRSANSSKQGDIRSTALAKVAGTRKSTTPELTEACALARHVRVEIQEALSTTEEHDFVPVRKPGAVKATEGVPVQSPRGTTIQEADEVDFSTVQGDGAMVSEFEIGQDEQQAQTPIETAAETEQPVSLLPESICVPEPEESSNDHNSPPDASTSAGISNIDTATATSVEQESAHNADLSVNAGNCTETTEVPSEEANGDTDNVSGSAIAGVAVVAADPSASNDALPSTEQSEVTEQDIDAGTVAAEVVTAPEDPPPSGRSAEAPSQQDS